MKFAKKLAGMAYGVEKVSQDGYSIVWWFVVEHGSEVFGVEIVAEMRRKLLQLRHINFYSIRRC